MEIISFFHFSCHSQSCMDWIKLKDYLQLHQVGRLDPLARVDQEDPVNKQTKLANKQTNKKQTNKNKSQHFKKTTGYTNT